MTIDFPGGTPADLIGYANEALGISLNAIIPDELSGVRLPPLRLRFVNFQNLNIALQASTSEAYAFESRDPDDGRSIWAFRAKKKSGPE
jgi:hypothetical protein